MLQIFVIFFREFLEIAILLGIIRSAIKNVRSANNLIGVGVLAGVILSCLGGVFVKKISEAFHGYGQEIISACILLLGSIMILWTIAWLNRSSLGLKNKIKSHANKVQLGEVSTFSISAIVAIAVFREGIEIILFSYGIFATSAHDSLSLSFAGIAGAVSALLVGLLIYLGIVTFWSKYLFSVTSGLLAFIAAGMSAKAANMMVSAQILPSFGALWDISEIISRQSFAGSVLHILIGYQPNPDIMELTFYAAPLLFYTISTFRRKVTNKTK